jgi:hypothetical protein
VLMVVVVVILAEAMQIVLEVSLESVVI